ncbi:hypothetical protein NEOLI_005436 [Neolecta irregularis DAH-3]|uniref:Uncharacterized protein n=1 Tax=Neolecta irregularis (strain DAH-3) TaxID=1198029 RepID=A0A1U7LR13_NEOID|nr:hypothetical protein NEOLI_005436 [Neolecta irregularis DAH-3]|eukprot:OLL25068.1 hypothetical protein NEOLI_005436 [Neolecta irregularis DAH-3]
MFAEAGQRAPAARAGQRRLRGLERRAAAGHTGAEPFKEGGRFAVPVEPEQSGVELHLAAADAVREIALLKVDCRVDEEGAHGLELVVCNVLA